MAMLQFTPMYIGDNRLREAFTSPDSVIWDKDAKYIYYLHGPLARTERGGHKVQGEDYAYTINGWLKLYNANTLDVTHDMGNDGTTSGYMSSPATIHKWIGRDSVGFSLGYYLNDYKAISLPSVATRPEAQLTSASTFHTGAGELFNGNIRHMVNAIANEKQYGLAYKYDQLNRIKQMQLYDGMDTTASGNNWSGASASTIHKHTFTYDANGNILTLDRYNNSAAFIDDLSYNYISGKNQLEYVDDPQGITSDDLGDQAAGNYTYTAIGELQSDATGGIDNIEWRVDGKVKKVTRTGNQAQLEFEYDPFGRRILKLSKPCSSGTPTSDSTQWDYTYYINDASGNVMATYTVEKTIANQTIILNEQMIYGSSRLGMRNRDKLLSTKTNGGGITDEAGDSTRRYCGYKRYEFTNHLGNVLLVTTDRKMSQDVNTDGTTDHFHCVVDAYYDYGPFGALMPGRSDGSNDYRFGFNGMEKSDEIYGSGNSYTAEYWQYDARLGRRWNVDPVVKHRESPYASFSNNPIFFIDPQGLNADWYKDDKGQYQYDKDVKSQGDLDSKGIKGTYVAESFYSNLMDDEGYGRHYGSDGTISKTQQYLPDVVVTGDHAPAQQFINTDPSLQSIEKNKHFYSDEDRKKIIDSYWSRHGRDGYEGILMFEIAIVLAPALTILEPLIPALPAIANTAISATITERVVSGGINLTSQLATNGASLGDVDVWSLGGSIVFGNPFIGSAATAPVSATYNDGFNTNSLETSIFNFAVGALGGKAYGNLTKRIQSADNIIGKVAVNNLIILSGTTIDLTGKLAEGVILGSDE